VPPQRVKEATVFGSRDGPDAARDKEAPMSNVTPLKPTAKFTVQIHADTAALVNKFVLLDQDANNSHGPRSVEKLAAMLLEDVALGVRDGNTWQGGHMATFILHPHGYVTG
jgi:hypothetical protein